jgi:hypothetical protein
LPFRASLNRGPGQRVLTIVLSLAMPLIAVVSSLGGTGHLAWNGFIGIRIPSTMASDEAWKVGQHAATVPAWCGFVAAAIVSVVSWTVVSSNVAVGICTIVVVLLVVTGIWSVTAASRAARANAPT